MSTCKCTPNFDTRCLCTPNNPSWTTCPEKLRYVEFMILNNSKPNGNSLFDKPKKGVCDLLESSRKLKQEFKINQTEINNVFSLMRNEELDDMSEHKLKAKKYDKYVRKCNFDSLLFYLYKLNREQLLSIRENSVILSGFVEVVLGNYDSAVNIFHNIQDSVIVYSYLAYIYDFGIFVEENQNRAFEYYALYYRGQNTEDEFIINTPFTRDIKLLYGYINEAMTIRKQYELLIAENKQLRERVTELEYEPDGVGYHEAKEHFEQLANNAN